MLTAGSHTRGSAPRLKETLFLLPEGGAITECYSGLMFIIKTIITKSHKSDYL